MLRRDADHPTDSMVLLWDAVAGGQPSPTPGEQAATFDLISTFLALDNAPMPDPGFLNRLEGEVIRLGTGVAATPTPSRSSRLLQGLSSISLRPAFRWDTASRGRFAGYGRWLAAQAAIAILILIAIGSVGVIYLTGQPDNAPTIPAAIVEATPQPGTPETETLLHTVIDPAAVGAEGQSEWTTASLFSFSLEPGEGFALDWGSSLNVFTMLRGELSVQSGSPSLVYRQGSNVPETVNAGERVTIVAGDSWVAGYETDVSGQNDGTSDADVLIHANTKDWAAFSPPRSFPDATPRGGHADDSNLDLRFDGPVTFDLQRVTLGQNEELNVVASDSETLLLVTDPGVMARITRDGASGGTSTNATALHTYPEGAYTIASASSDTATFYIARMSNAPPEAHDAAATPAAGSASPEATPVADGAVQPETIVRLHIDPAGLDIQSPDNWNRMEFSLVHVGTGESLTTDHPYFTCCDGIAIFHIQQGSASLVVDGPVDLYTAGDEQHPARIAAGVPVTVGVGNTAVFARNDPAIVTNSGSPELLMLAGYADEYSPMPGPAMGPISMSYDDRPIIFDSNLDPIAAESVDVSFERIMLDPGALTYIDSNPDERLVGWFPERSRTTVRIMRGEHNTLSDNPLESFAVQSFVMDYFSPGPYTFFNAGEHPATIHLMRIVPAGDASAGAAPPSAVQETSARVEPFVSFLADP